MKEGRKEERKTKEKKRKSHKNFITWINKNKPGKTWRSQISDLNTSNEMEYKEFHFSPTKKFTNQVIISRSKKAKYFDLKNTS